MRVREFTRSGWARIAMTAPILAIATASALAAPAPPAQKSATVSATVLQPASVAVVSNLSAGNTKTNGANPNGTVIVPGTYPLFATPGPSYPSTTPQNGAKAVAPSAARIDVSGSPGNAFILTFQSWTQVAGTAGATMNPANNTYYSPSNSPTNMARGVFNAQGKATIYIGGTVVLARDPSGSTVDMKPAFSISYN
jgi:hypothetical protein